MNYKQLKLLARMVFDHVTRVFPLTRLLLPLAVSMETAHPALADWLLDGLPSWLALIGRAAPLYLFCLAEGFVHTRNAPRYLRRIFLTACIAQVPYTLFDLAEAHMYGITQDWRETGGNILFTLALGLLALMLYRRLSDRGHPVRGLAAVAAMAALARLLHCEGKEGYILLIFVFYLTRNLPRWQRALLFLPTVLLARWGLVWWMLTERSYHAFINCAVNVGGNYIWMLVTLAYNGEKGDAGKGFQRFMYIFYPAHFAVLALIVFLRPPLI